MEQYAGIDVSLEQSRVCVMDATGKVVREAKVASGSAALARFFQQLERTPRRIGLGDRAAVAVAARRLAAAGFAAVLLETRHVKAALLVMTVKTDRRDARGIAQMMRLGWCRPVRVRQNLSFVIRPLSARSAG